MKAKTVHCEECVEEIPHDEVYWEDERLYCGRCGSELEVTQSARDVLDEFSRRRPVAWKPGDDDVVEEEDDEDEDDDDFDDEDEDDDEAAPDEDEDEEDENGRRSR